MEFVARGSRPLSANQTVSKTSGRVPLFLATSQRAGQKASSNMGVFTPRGVFPCELLNRLRRLRAARADNPGLRLVVERELVGCEGGRDVRDRRAAQKGKAAAVDGERLAGGDEAQGVGHLVVVAVARKRARTGLGPGQMHRATVPAAIDARERVVGG